MAVLRIALGLCLLWTLLLSDFGGVRDVLWASPQRGGLLPLSREHWLYWLLPSDESLALRLLFGLATVGAVASTLGAGGRGALLLTQQFAVALSQTNVDIKGGYDTLLAVGFLLLACSRCTSTLSLDCWLRHRRWTDTSLHFAWPRYALIVQLLLMYGFTGVQKLGLPWTPMGGYSALHYVLSDPTWIRWDLGDLRPWRVGLAFATAVTWHWEQFAPLLFVYYYYRATQDLPGRIRAWCLRHDPRLAFAVVGMGLHVGILALLDVGPFSLVALSYYIALWSPEQWQTLLGRVRRATKLERTRSQITT
jgi:hypothetical protein